MKTQKKKYEGMTTAELRRATKEFDAEVTTGIPGRPMNAAERSAWAKARAKKPTRGRPVTGEGVQVISLSMEKGLLRRADKARAKAHKTRAEIVAAALEIYLSRIAS
jgi:hypothetical protein